MENRQAWQSVSLKTCFIRIITVSTVLNFIWEVGGGDFNLVVEWYFIYYLCILMYYFNKAYINRWLQCYVKYRRIFYVKYRRIFYKSICVLKTHIGRDAAGFSTDEYNINPYCTQHCTITDFLYSWKINEIFSNFLIFQQ